MPTADPLSSWRPGPVRDGILAFLERVTTPGSPDWLPPPERIAVLDNDGTLWPEHPLPFQAAFAVDELRRRLPAEPQLEDDPMVQAALAGDLGALLAGPRFEGLLRVVALTHAGMDTDTFRETVEAWLASARHPRFERPYDALTYVPMQELLALLRACDFRCFIVSGGGVDFMRVWVERVYGIPPERVVGSCGLTRYELRDGVPRLFKTVDHLFVNDGAGKPAGIHQFIGRRPVFCCGNSDGDLAMLQVTTIAHGRPSLGLLLHHTDAEREYAYDAHSTSTGRLVEALAQAPERGWLVADMARDWSRVFADPP
ncbi:MAG: HAD family hydrolase [Synechococcaceae cyanobacterium]|nr:HAD family hydrolase [Synechococcaceae cyanobacterium]